MKSYMLKLAGLATLSAFIVTGSFAQAPKKTKQYSKHSDDVLIIRQKVDKDSKITIEMKGGDVLVNGKPISEFKDDNIIISKRKELTGPFGEVSDLADLRELRAPASRFRGGTTFYNGDEAPRAFSLGNGNKAFLGVTTEKADEGAEITDITDESAAEKAGLKEGDIITKIDDIKVEGPEDLTKTIGKFKPEDKVTVTVKRDKKEQKFTATLKKRSNGFAFSTSPEGSFNYDMAPFKTLDGMSWGGNQHRLGLKAQETEDGKGLKVLEVDEESNAEKAGIKEGDIITEFDGTEVNNIDKLRELSRTAMGKPTFKVKLTRDGKAQDIDVKIPKNLKTTNL